MPKYLTAELALHWAEQTVEDVQRETVKVDCKPEIRDCYLRGIKTGFMQAVGILRLQGYLVEDKE
jgi:hypothetical protein